MSFCVVSNKISKLTRGWTESHPNLVDSMTHWNFVVAAIGDQPGAVTLVTVGAHYLVDAR